MKVMLVLRIIDGRMPSMVYGVFRQSIIWPERLRLPVIGDAIQIDNATHDVHGVVLFPQDITDRVGEDVTTAAVIASIKKIWPGESDAIDDLIAGFNLQKWTLVGTEDDEDTKIIPNEY